MKKVTKYKWLPVLMIISQVMLTALVIQWTRGQYKEKENLLFAEIRSEYNRSADKTFDTLLLRYFPIATPAGDSASLIINTNSPVVSIQGGDSRNKIRNGIYAVTLSKEKPLIKSTPEGSPEQMIKMEMGTGAGRDEKVSKEKELFIRSARLVYKKGSDTSNTRSGIYSMLRNEENIDLFKDIFFAGMKEKGWNFNFKWVILSDSVFNEIGNRKNLIEGGVFGAFPGLFVTGYKSFLVKKLSTQILFGLILLLITGTAFFSSHRSMKNQMLMSRMREDFISNISHELKTPVSTVKVTLEALQKYDILKDAGTTAEYLKMASMETERLNGLINKVLENNELEYSRDMIKKEPADLSKMIKDILSLMHYRISSQNAMIVFEDIDRPVMVPLDRVYIEGVIINLIDNSLKYSDKKPEINISLRDDSAYAFMTVSDNGPGIPQEYISKVFDKFFRIPSENRHNVKGYGLGLSFAKMVMENHGGTISVQNNKKGGCSFILKFPVS